MHKIIKQTLPPFIFSFFKKVYNHKFTKKKFKKLFINKPEWIKIKNNSLKDCYIFVPKKSLAESMFENSHDNFLLKYISENDIVFDVGAHIGSNSMFFAKKVGPNGKVLSFEPNVFNVKAFEKNLEKNEDLKKIIQIHNLALSNEKGEANFIFTDDIYGGSSSGSFIESADTTYPKEGYEGEKGFERTKTKIETLDKIIEETNIIPDVIKIDVEGAEYLVLEGAKNLLSKEKPLLLIEIHSIFNMFKICKILNEINYSTEIINKEPDGRCFIISKFNKS